LFLVFTVSGVARGQQTGAADSSYLPVAIKQTTATIQKRMEAAKPAIMKRHKTERFFKQCVINNHSAIGDGPIKTFPLRGIKDTPPYFHDGRLLTLDDTVEFFNLIFELKLAEQEERDLVAFMRQL
jgi:hypothetical protein